MGDRREQEPSRNEPQPSDQASSEEVSERPPAAFAFPVLCEHPSEERPSGSVLAWAW